MGKGQKKGLKQGPEIPSEAREKDGTGNETKDPPEAGLSKFFFDGRVQGKGV